MAFFINDRQLVQMVGWVEIRLPDVGFRSSTHPTSSVRPGQSNRMIETQHRRYSPLSSSR